MSIARAQCCFLFVDVLKMPKLEEEMAATACWDWESYWFFFSRSASVLKPLSWDEWVKGFHWQNDPMTLPSERRWAALNRTPHPLAVYYFWGLLSSFFLLLLLFLFLFFQDSQEVRDFKQVCNWHLQEKKERIKPPGLHGISRAASFFLLQGIRKDFVSCFRLCGEQVVYTTTARPAHALYKRNTRARIARRGKFLSFFFFFTVLLDQPDEDATARQYSGAKASKIIRSFVLRCWPALV